MLIRNPRYSLMAMLVLAIMTLSSLNPALALADAQGAEPLAPQEGETPESTCPWCAAPGIGQSLLKARKLRTQISRQARRAGNSLSMSAILS